MSGKEAGDGRGVARRLNKKEINACPMTKWRGPVHVIRTAGELADAVRHLAKETLLGLDTETRPAFKKGESYPPSLLQLAGEQEVFIFQLQYLGLPKPLRRLLAQPEITKAGVALTYDIRELQKLAPFQSARCVDLDRMAREAGLLNQGLRGLAAVLLGLRISKAAQTSNWARSTLTPLQIRYAATDAWLGRILFQKLLQIKDSGDSAGS
ncbi:MAG: 3'-5' exonuclease domain-containing protein 2 [Desulfovibrionales bacterium]|nr:3'-5' exonuclease domain-containing protein 2 [Desulfovibrionales bacterium]